MIRTVVSLVVAGVLTVGPVVADPPKIDRTIGKEPVYKTKSPKYGLLAFGKEGKDRIWLVLDGDTLYVDRNGDGDLTEPGKKIAPAVMRGLDPKEFGLTFRAGELNVGGRTHKGLSINFRSLASFAATPFGKRSDVKAILAKESNALSVRISFIDVEMPELKGGGLGGRVVFGVAGHDLNGVLQFSDKPANAPVIRLGGPLQITFYGELPSLRVGRTSDLVLMVGTPGIGPGTFAMLNYENTIPENAKPIAEVYLPSAKPTDPLLHEKWEILGRC
jgi:hypothetical protein